MRAYRVAYDGQPYHGFQRQPDVDTVEGRLRSALVRLGVCERGEGLPDRYAAAGRTDAGVSARTQTVAFDAPAWLSPAAFNGELPDDVRVWASADVPEDFHAPTTPPSAPTPTTCTRRRMRTDPNTNRSTTGGGPTLSTRSPGHTTSTILPRTRPVLSGPSPSTGPGTVSSSSSSFGRRVRRQLVRRLVSLAAAVADGSAPLSKVDRILSPEPVSGPDGVPPAPPEPLVLTDVRYPNVSFTRDEDAAVDARTVFARRRATARTTARVADHITDGL